MPFCTDLTRTFPHTPPPFLTSLKVSHSSPPSLTHLTHPSAFFWFDCTFPLPPHHSLLPSFSPSFHFLLTSISLFFLPYPCHRHPKLPPSLFSPSLPPSRRRMGDINGPHELHGHRVLCRHHMLCISRIRRLLNLLQNRYLSSGGTVTATHEGVHTVYVPRRGGVGGRISC